MSLLDMFSGNPDGNTPFEQASPLRRFALALGGQQDINEYNKPALTQLGVDLSNGNIDQTQYLKSIAQYDPETYNKIAMAQIQNMPAPVKTYNNIKQLKDAGLELLKKGDHAGAQEMYDNANTLMAIARPQAYGVNTFTLPSDGNNPTNTPTTAPQPAATGNYNDIQSAPVANLMPNVSPQGDPSMANTQSAPASNPIAQQIIANAGAKKGAQTKADLGAKAEDSANGSQEIFNKLTQNLDAMTDMVKQGGVPSSKYFIPANIQASVAQNIPQLGNGDTATNYTAFDSLNAPAALNVLGELAKSGNMRTNKTIAQMVKDGFMVDPNLSDAQKLVKIATIKAELQNAATASTNVANKEMGQPTQAYTPMPTMAAKLSAAAVAAGDGDYMGKLDMTDPRVKKALDAGYTPDEIMQHLGKK